MQHMSHARLCQQAEQIADSYEHLRKSYVGACLIKALWTPELSAYLREEGNTSPTTKEELTALLERMAQIGNELGELHSHVDQLCVDLARVDRGESFSV